MLKLFGLILAIRAMLCFLHNKSASLVGAEMEKIPIQVVRKILKTISDEILPVTNIIFGSLYRLSFKEQPMILSTALCLPRSSEE